MISGTFHVMAQEWRYYAREKSLIHTLHLGELTSSQRGDTVLIAPVPPINQKGGNGYKFPALPLPGNPYLGANAKLVTNDSVIVTCFGGTNHLGQIIAQSKMSITVTPTIITMVPQEPGYFVVHAEAQGDLRTLHYYGPSADGSMLVELFKDSIGGTPIAKSNWRMQLINDRSGAYLNMVPHTSCETLVMCSGDALIAYGPNLGTQPPAYLSMWAYKVADL